MTKNKQPQHYIFNWEKPILFMAKKVKEDHPNQPLALYFKEHKEGGWLYVAPEGSNLAKSGKQIITIEQFESESEQGRIHLNETKFPKNTKVLIPINKLDEKQPIKELLDSFDSSAFVFYNIAKNKMYIEEELMTFEKETHFMYDYMDIIPKEEYNHLMIGYLLREVRRDGTMPLHQFINEYTENISFLSNYLEKTIFTSEDYSVAYESDYSDCQFETGLLAVEYDEPKETEPLPQNIQWAKDGFRFEALVEKFQKPIIYMLSELGDESSPDELNLMYDFEYEYLILAYEAPSEFTPSLILGSVPTSLAKTNPYEAFDKLLQQTTARCLHYWTEYTPEFIIQSDLINQEEKSKTVIDQIDDYKRLELSLIKKCFQQCRMPAKELKNQGEPYILDDIEDVGALATTSFRTWVKIFQKHPYFTIPGIHFTPGGDALGGRYDGIFE